MDTQHDIALAHALTGIPGPLPPSGVIHLTAPHANRFTVVGNHLAQHAELSLTAIGLAVHIQSLPDGAPVGIKAIARRFPEGEILIAAALRELEAHGYLHRGRLRLPDGRIVTRTVSCNRPGAALRAHAAGPSAPASEQRRVPPPSHEAAAPTAAGPVPERCEASTAPAFLRASELEPAPAGPPPPAPPPPPPEPLPPPQPECPLAFVPSPAARKPPPPPLPRPRELTPDLHRTAVALLSGLRRHAPHLVLSESDIEQLAPGAAAWLENDAHPDAIRHALTSDLPQPLKHPAKLLKHRLTRLLPPALPGVQEVDPPRRTLTTPFQTCEGCDRAFRSPAPGHCRDCRDCRAELWEAA